MMPKKDAEIGASYRCALRQQGISRRMALSTSEHAILSATVCEHVHKNFPQLAGMRVAFCWPVRNEPDLRPLILSYTAAAEATGFVALLPVVMQADAPLAFRAWSPESAMIADRYGIPSPVEGGFIEPEALLLPVNAFDADGYRIGYGGGFFDRTLAALDSSPLSIGVGFELARVDSIRPAAHDVRLDAMVSELGVFRHAKF